MSRISDTEQKSCHRVVVSRLGAICSRWESYKAEAQLVDGPSGGRAMVSAPCLLLVYQSSWRQIPSLARRQAAAHPKSRRARRSLAITANCSAYRRARGSLVVHNSPGVRELNSCCLEVLFASCGIGKTAELQEQRTLHRCPCGKNPGRWARERKVQDLSVY